MPRNAFGDDEEAWSLPTTNAPWGQSSTPGNASPSSPFQTPGTPTSSPSGGPSWGNQPATGQPATSPFSSAAGPGAPAGSFGATGPIGAPRIWLAAAAGAVLLGAVLGFAAKGKPALSIVGWLLAGAVAIGLIAVFTLRDTRRRASIWYTTNESVAVLRNVILALAVLAVALNAWQFADWAARR